MKRILKKIIATNILIIMILMSSLQTVILTITQISNTVIAAEPGTSHSSFEDTNDNMWMYDIRDVYNRYTGLTNLYTVSRNTFWTYARTSEEAKTKQYKQERYCILGGIGVNDGIYDENSDRYYAEYALKTNFVNAGSEYLIETDALNSINGKHYLFAGKNQSERANSKAAIIWITKNSLPNIKANDRANGTERSLYKNNLNDIIKANAKSGYTNYNLDNLDDGVVQIIQQYAIWHFINESDSDYKPSDETFIDTIKKNGNSLTSEEKNKAKALYTSLINCAGNATKRSQYGIDTTNCKIEMSETPVIENTHDNTYKFGPISIKLLNEANNQVVSTNKLEKIEGTLKGPTGISNVKYLNENGVEVELKNKVNNGKIYVEFTTANHIPDNTRVKFQVNAKFKTMLTNYNAYLYTKDREHQPIVEIEKTAGVDTSVAYKIATFEKKDVDFDVALTKRIAQVYRYVGNQWVRVYEASIKEQGETSDFVSANGPASNNIIYGQRLKEYKEDRDISNDVTTNKYILDKTPVEVMPGDIVRYHLRVYNEGEETAQINTIRDFLPNGLSVLDTTNLTKAYYNRHNYDNKQNNILKDYEVYPSGAKKVDLEVNKQLAKNKQLDYYIECYVDGNLSETLINSAEIIDYKIYDPNNINQNVSDCDSTPHNLLNNNETNNQIGYANYLDELNDNLKNENITSLNKRDFDYLEDDEDFEQIKVKGFDMALRKSIMEITTDGTKNTFDRIPSKYDYISYNLDTNEENKFTYIGYYHSKEPLTVKDGSIIKYNIRIYNEGYIEGEAREVTDYLLAGLELAENSDVNRQFGWVKDESKSNDTVTVIKTNYLQNKKIAPANGKEGFGKLNGIGSPEHFISAFGESSVFWKDIQVECKVNKEKIKEITKTNLGNKLGNVAEITDYGFYKTIFNANGTLENRFIPAQADISEADSTEKTLEEIDGEGINDKIIYYYNQYVREDTLYYGGQEDDDDYEVVKLENFDLALRKFITKVGETDITNRIPQIKTDSSEGLDGKKGVGTYYHSKKTLKVNTGDKIVYTIRIFNEGDIDGYAKEITDYLPKGLEFVPIVESQINRDNGWTATKDETNGYTTVKTNHLQGTLIKSSKGKEGYDKIAKKFNKDNPNDQYGATSSSEKFWEDVQIECKVTSLNNNEVLTNVAEITVYGYGQEHLVEAQTSNVDLDSIQNNILTTLNETNVNEAIYKYKRRASYDTATTLGRGIEDDDDFESIKVQSTFSTDIQIEKTNIEETEHIEGAKFNIVLNSAMNSVQNGEIYVKESSIYEENNAETNSSGNWESTISSLITNKNYFYEITEKSCPSGYENTFEGYKILIPFHIDRETGNLEKGIDSSLQVILPSQYSTEKGFLIINDENNEIIENSNDLYQKIIVNFDGINRKITITVKDKTVETGKYQFNIHKSSNGKYVSHFKFNGNFTINENTEEKTFETTGTYGYKAFNNLPLDSEGTDIYEITESSDNSDEYIKLSGSVKLNVKKEKLIENESIKYIITEIGFENGTTVRVQENTNSAATLDTTYEDGTQAHVWATYNDNNGGIPRIDIYISNPKVKGSYNLNIEKIGENAETKLENVTFNVEEIDENGNSQYVKENEKTDENGRIEVEKNIEKSGQRVKYTIYEIENDDKSYYKFAEGEKIDVFVETEKVNYKYKLKSVSFDENNPDVNTTKVMLENGKEVTVNLNTDIDNGIITVTVPNEKKKGYYNLVLKKVDLETGEPLAGVKFKVTNTINGNDVELTPNLNKGTNKYGRVAFMGSETFNDTSVCKLITEDNVNDIDEYKITEIDLNGKGYIKLDNSNPIVFYIFKDPNTYEISAVSFTNAEDGEKCYKVQNNKITKNYKIENSDETVPVELSFDNSSKVCVKIPNIELTGKYGIELLKTGKNNANLPGVKFTVKKIGEEEETIIDEQPTGTDGKITIVENNTVITKSDLGTEKYLIKENIPISGYQKIIDDIILSLTKERVGNEYKVTKVSLNNSNNNDNSDETEVTLIDNTSKITVTAEVTEDGIVRVTIPNEELKGSYGLEIVKTGKDEETYLEGVEFNIIEGETEETKENITPSLNTTNNQGKLTVFTEKEITFGTKDITDVFEISEETLPSGLEYVKLKDPITIYVKKGTDNEQNPTKYVVKSVTFDNNLGTKEVELENGERITAIVNLNAQTGMITLTIQNEEIKGSYELEIVKTGKNNTRLNGVKFDIYEGNSDRPIKQGTTVDGKVTVFDEKRPITASTKDITDTFRIEEVETISGYVRLSKPLTIYVSKGLNSTNTAYVVNSVSFSPDDPNEREETIDNMTARLDLQNNVVTLTIPNEQMVGSYGLEIVKKGNNNVDLDGVEFKVSEENNETPIKQGTTVNGKVTVFETRPITSENVGTQDVFEVEEVKTADGYLKLPRTMKIYITKGLDNEENPSKYVVKSASFSKTDAAKITDDIELPDGKTVTVVLNVQNNVVTLTVPNEQMVGSYGLEIVKKGKNNVNLDGVEFKVSEENKEGTIQGTTVNGKVTVFETRPITSENVGTQDVFEVEEVKAVDGYLKLPRTMKIYITKGLDNEENPSKYVVKSASFSKTDVAKITDDIELPDGKTITVVLNVQNNVVTLTVPNEQMVGSYGFEIVKIDKEKNPIKNVEFKVTEGEDTVIKDERTNVEGKITVFTSETRKIDSANVNNVDEFTVEEVKVDREYIALESPLKVYIRKGVDNEENPSKYEVKSASFSKTEEKTSQNIVLATGKTITVVLSKENNVVTLTVPNFKIEGRYNLELIKIDQKDGESVLPGVTFDIKTMKGEEEVKLYDVEGNIVNTKGLVTNAEGKIILSNINITEVADYNFEVTETKVPEGYVMLKDKIKVSFKTKVDEETKDYIVTDGKVQGMAELDVINNKLTLRLQNGQFDLALRKYISSVKVNVGTSEEKTVTVKNRVPVFKVDEKGNYIYEQAKSTVLVGNQNIVEYTLRVYNEGSISGYASKIKDDIPEGLEFLKDNETNKKYGWKLLDEKGNEVEEVNKAKYIVTDYLSKAKETNTGENLLKAFNLKEYKEGKITAPDYKEVKVAFKVTMPNTDDRIITNKAQISDDSDKDGNKITDKDSTPDEWIDGEDDQDIEKIKVQYFDLSLRKWVSKAIVIEDGKETTTETGHTAEDNLEEIVKVDLKDSKINKVVVKFEYKIRVKNEGEITGYVKEISDYIPEGLKFDKSDNPTWQEAEGKITTEELKNTKIDPGETKEVSVILTWINRKDNLGLKQNIAEISKDYNVYGSPDIDSIPNNKVSGEDDIDDAPVMITIKTGQEVIFTGLIIAVLTMIGTSVILIKKYVVK